MNPIASPETNRIREKASAKLLRLVAAAGSALCWSSRQTHSQSGPVLAMEDRPIVAPWQEGALRDRVPPCLQGSPVSQEVSQRLVAAQEAVRRDMADYLHGHVQSKLVALSMSLSTCQKLLDRDPAQACRLLERIQEELQRVQDEDLRQVTRELYPAIIKMGLVPAMRSLVGRFSDLLEVELIIDTDVFFLDSAWETKVPEELRLGIYRIAEEALNNVLKHARASHVEINLVCDPSEQLVLSVVDDGEGFDPLEAGASHGLVMMADYAQAIGGNTRVRSSLGHGTTVNLALPVRAPQTAVATITGPDPAALEF